MNVTPTPPLLKLRTSHGSFPANPLLAEPMYLAGYIERLSTGTRDMICLCDEKGLKEPDFKQEDVFKAIIWRTGQVAGIATGEVTGEVRKMIFVLNGEMKRSEIQQTLQLKHDDFFRTQYIIPALNSGFIEMKYPDTPNHPKQKYRLTEKGKKVKKKIETETSSPKN